MNYDVVIVGAGPGGATLATLLAQAGYSILILEKDAFPRYQIGESLLPATVRDLADMLGIREQLAASGFVIKRGATFSWGSDPNALWHLNFGGPRSEEAVLAPEVPAAYNVARQGFDELLLQNALRHGVTVKHGCVVRGFLEQDGAVTGVSYTDVDGQSLEVNARFVADASGQRSKLARDFGKRTMSRFFEKLAVWGYFENGERLPAPLSGNVVFQTVGASWVWYIPLDDKITSVGVVVPSSAWSRTNDPQSFLNEHIAACPLITKFLESSSPAQSAPYDSFRVCSEYSYCYSSFWKPGAFMLGDAACFVDVLLSSGVHMATYSAVLAAQSVNSVLKGQLSEEAAMNEFETRVRKEYAIFYNGLVGLYDMTRSAQEYGAWLRALLIDTSGIAYEPEQLAGRPQLAAGESTLLELSRNNLARMKDYNETQLKYDGGPQMTDHSLPELPYTLVPNPDMRSWQRVI